MLSVSKMSKTRAYASSVFSTKSAWKRVEAQLEEVMVKAVDAEVEAMRVVVLVEVMNGGEWW